jgi:hypothetical protein
VVWISLLRLFLLMRERGPVNAPSPAAEHTAPYLQPEPLDR